MPESELQPAVGSESNAVGAPSIDYYKALGVSRGAAPNDIANAFRKLALATHPSLPAAKTPVGAALDGKFATVCEAYDVLSQPACRAIYDAFGAKGLKNGVPQPDGTVRGGRYAFTKTPDDVFTSFFGTASPFVELLGPMGADTAPPQLFGELTGMTLPKPPSLPAPRVVTLDVTLSELYTGAVRRVDYARRVLQPDSTTVETPECVQVRIAPGWADGDVVTYDSMGDDRVGAAGPAALEVVLKQEAETRWTRAGDNLEYKSVVSLADALTGFICEVPHLDGRTLSISINGVVRPGTSKLIPGEGMPIKGGGGKGDLALTFDVAFPERLEPKQREIVKQALDGCEYK